MFRCFCGGSNSPREIPKPKNKPKFRHKKSTSKGKVTQPEDLPVMCQHGMASARLWRLAGSPTPRPSRGEGELPRTAHPMDVVSEEEGVVMHAPKEFGEDECRSPRLFVDVPDELNEPALPPPPPGWQPIPTLDPDKVKPRAGNYPGRISEAQLAERQRRLPPISDMDPHVFSGSKPQRAPAPRSPNAFHAGALIPGQRYRRPPPPPPIPGPPPLPPAPPPHILMYVVPPPPPQIPPGKRE